MPKPAARPKKGSPTPRRSGTLRVAALAFPDVQIKGHWSGVAATSGSTASTSGAANAPSGRWTFRGRKGEPWSAGADSLR